MSLLLQALKKAEEAKRLREAAVAEQVDEQGVEVKNEQEASGEAGLIGDQGDQGNQARGDASTLSLEEPIWAVPAELEWQVDLPANVVAQAEIDPPLASIESRVDPPPAKWVFVPIAMDVEAPTKLPITAADLPETEPDIEPVLDAPALDALASSPVAKAIPDKAKEEDLTWLNKPAVPSPTLAAQAAPSPSLTPTVTPPAPQTPKIAPNKSRSRSKNLPWLILLGVLLMAGLGGYFWWQYQALNMSQTAAPPPAAAVAEAPPAAAASEPAIEVIKPAPIAAIASAVVILPPTHALPKPYKGDAASVEERSGAPNGAGIRFDTQNTEAVVPLPLAMAYRAFQQGDYRAAEEGYRRMLQLDARNRDALLGMAALAMKRGAGAEAAYFYRQILSLYPRDEVAQSALYSLTPTNENSEAGLRQLSGQQADAAFALANLYAGQNRWSEAQSAYFQALTLDAGNADYAFNLAISLEHLQENKSAARYYRQALAGKGTFDHTIAEERLKALDSP
jgi:tetratricopeptide (TPR) repeat protein